MRLTKSKTFWIGFSIALGGILAVSVAAFGHGGGTQISNVKADPTPPPPAGPPADVIAALQTPRTAADALTGAAAATAQGLSTGQAAVQSDLQPGGLDLGQSRRLLDGVGSSNVSLFAIPTSKGQVCTVFSAVYGTAGCTAGFTREAPISWDVRDPDQLGGGAPAIVNGLVPNDVASVSVSLDGTTHEATLQRNGFFYELPSTASWPDAIIVGYKNGSTLKLEIASVQPR
jgi:hypothetical protein